MAIPHVSCVVDADTPMFEEDEGIISFSYNSGFYPTPFSLILSTSTHGTIYYTLDGSVPYENNVAATMYASPIPVTDATFHENIWSMRSDTSLGYTYDAYELPQYAVDKCTVVKAAVRYADGSWSPVQTRSYFVGLQGRESLNGIGTISLSLNPESLFDYETGIYILGKTHDDNPWMPGKSWWWTTANFHNRGKDWEREAFVQFFDAQGELQLSQSIGIRIRGGMSRGLAQKGFNLYARKIYDENKKFNYDFFKNGYKAKKLTLFAGGNDTISKSSDYIVSASCDNVAFSLFHFVPYALFLNGEYWGMYWLTEKYDDRFIAKTYGVAEDDVIIMKNWGIEEGKDDDMTLWNDMRTFITQNDMSDTQNYKHVSELISIESFIQYYATEIYIGRYNDWPAGNYAAWRTRQAESGYTDGRWRWLLFDVNSGSMNQISESFNALTFVEDNDALFSSLMQNKDFRLVFANALTTAATVWFPAQKMTALIDAYAQSYTSNLEASYKRWFGSSAPSGISDTLAERKAFFAHRAEVVSAYRDSILAME